MTSGFTINPTLLISLVSLVSGYKTAQPIQFQNLNPSTQVIPKLKSNFLLKIQSFRYVLVSFAYLTMPSTIVVMAICRHLKFEIFPFNREIG